MKQRICVLNLQMLREGRWQLPLQDQHMPLMEILKQDVAKIQDLILTLFISFDVTRSSYIFHRVVLLPIPRMFVGQNLMLHHQNPTASEDSMYMSYSLRGSSEFDFLLRFTRSKAENVNMSN